MEDQLGNTVVTVILIGVVLFAIAFCANEARKYYRHTKSEITRYHNFMNDHLSKPVRGEVKHDTMTGELGAPLQIFKTGMITFADGHSFLTENETAFHHIAKTCSEKNPEFALHYQEEAL